MWMNIWTDNVSGRQEMNGSKDLKTIIYFKGVYDTLYLFTDHLIWASVKESSNIPFACPSLSL